MLKLRVFLAGHVIAMVTYCVTKIIPTCSPVIEQFFDTMIVASIGHVPYINILTWLRGFRVKLLYLVLFSLYSSLFWELRDKRNLKNLQFWPESHGAMLEYWYIQHGLLIKNGNHDPSKSVSWKVLETVLSKVRSIAIICCTTELVTGMGLFMVWRHRWICIVVSLCKHACSEVCDVKPGIDPHPLLARCVTDDGQVL